ncbi:hypothetical protein [Virgibacillus salexigens]|uniref:Protein-export membrane protein SecG n=1 Tax=Virgibacillus kapii TaxID=1638645 RepID=A0ABQ2D7B8_9BACI|nr:hypothetical protein [Virgibacillus kapii]GGJ48591.1 hypothetical protein GCM10007111_08390 [Virgibacillus kapii]
MIISFQIVLLLIILVSLIGTAGEKNKEKQKVNALFGTVGIAAFVLTIILV